MRPPAAMRQLADLRDQLSRIERLRLGLIDGQISDMLLPIDPARDAITGELRRAKGAAAASAGDLMGSRGVDAATSESYACAIG